MNWTPTGWDQEYNMEIHLFEGQYAQGNRKKGKNVLADNPLPMLFVYLVVTEVSGTYL